MGAQRGGTASLLITLRLFFRTDYRLLDGGFDQFCRFCRFFCFFAFAAFILFRCGFSCFPGRYFVGRGCFVSCNRFGFVGGGFRHVFGRFVFLSGRLGFAAGFCRFQFCCFRFCFGACFCACGRFAFCFGCIFRRFFCLSRRCLDL